MERAARPIGLDDASPFPELSTHVLLRHAVDARADREFGGAQHLRLNPTNVADHIDEIVAGHADTPNKISDLSGDAGSRG